MGSELEPKTYSGDLLKLSIILGPLPVDHSWRKRKRQREAAKCLKYMVQGAAFMLAIVIISYWMVQP